MLGYKVKRSMLIQRMNLTATKVEICEEKKGEILEGPLVMR